MKRLDPGEPNRRWVGRAPGVYDRWLTASVVFRLLQEIGRRRGVDGRASTDGLTDEDER